MTKTTISSETKTSSRNSNLRNCLQWAKVAPEHKYIQNLIKKWVEGIGYKATIEKPIQGNKGQVDIALEKENISIACEITITTNIDHELSNVKKCLANGYDHVILITPDRIRSTAPKDFL